MPYQKHKRNKHGLTREQCRRGGSRTRGYETADDARQRALRDAKGAVLREGVTYSSVGGTIKECQWQKRRALYGRVDQVELVADGRVVVTMGETLLRNRMRWLKQ